jgi:tetratricopeptide (TPR) repeat protein
MSRTLRAVTLLAVCAVLLSTAGCNWLKARDQLNKGVHAYKAAKYEQAIEHFEAAIALDPKLINARLYLATALAQQYIPNLATEDNIAMGEKAIAAYKDVLEHAPDNINSVKGIAYLHLQMENFDSAKEFYRKAVEMDPNDPEPYYSVAVIDWTSSYRPRMERRAELGLRPDEPLRDRKVCEQLRADHLANIEEGMEMLQKAIALRPDYDDAMAYLNLLYRERADLQCGNPEARAADLKTADEWVDKTMATKRMKAEKAAQQQGGGIHLEN